MKNYLHCFISILLTISLDAQVTNNERDANKIYLDSKEFHGGSFSWVMKKASEISSAAEDLSRPGYTIQNWMPAIVPGTVLNSLVYNKKYPEPYYGINNKLTNKLLPDIAQTGRDFYTYWFHTDFVIPADYKNKNIWLQIDGINYRAEIWVNGNLVNTVNGMFKQDYIDITDFAKVGESNGLAIKVYPVDMPGSNNPKPWRARGENKNGGDGNIGLNTTMLMTVGWDFTEIRVFGEVSLYMPQIKWHCVIHSLLPICQNRPMINPMKPFLLKYIM